MTGATMTRRCTPTTKVAGAGLRTVGKAAREQAGGSTGEPTGRRTVAEIIPPHGGRLMAPWKPGQSGNPDGRPKGRAMLRRWHWKLYWTVRQMH